MHAQKKFHHIEHVKGLYENEYKNPDTKYYKVILSNGEEKIYANLTIKKYVLRAKRLGLPTPTYNIRKTGAKMLINGERGRMVIFEGFSKWEFAPGLS